MCMQKGDGVDDVVGDEDCLYLNVFTPYTVSIIAYFMLLIFCDN